MKECLHPLLSGVTGYKRGCRCDRCRVENREYVARARERRSKSGTTHGTTTGYGDGCRCESCKSAQAERHARWVDRDPARARALRAKVSRDAYARDPISSKARRRALQQDSVEAATRSHYQWTGPELEIALRTDLTAHEAALMLGRTYAAVEAQRQLHKVDPRKQNLAGLDDRDNAGRSES